MKNAQNHILNLQKIEDLFFCVDVLTRTRFSLGATEEGLAADIDRIITCLTYSSEKVLPPDKHGDPAKKFMPAGPPKPSRR